MKSHIKLGRIFGIEIGLNELPVMNNGRIEGFITRAGVLRLLQTRAALDM